MVSTPARSFSLAAALATCTPAAAPAPARQPTTLVAVALSAVDSVAILDGSSLDLVATLAVGDNPHEISASPDGTRAYVANSGESSISMIDVSGEPRVAATWALPDGIGVHDVEATMDGRVIAVSGRRNIALELDAATGRVLRTDTISRAGAWMVETTGADRTVVVASMEGGAITLLRRGTRQELPAATGEIDAAMAPGGKHVWSVNFQTGDLTVLDATTGALVRRLRSGAMATRVLFLPGDSTALTVNGGDSTVVAWQVSTMRRLATVRLPRSPKVIAASPDGTRAFVSHPGGAVSAIDLSSMAVVRTVPLAGGPDGVAVLARTPDRDARRGAHRDAFRHDHREASTGRAAPSAAWRAAASW